MTMLHTQTVSVECYICKEVKTIRHHEIWDNGAFLKTHPVRDLPDGWNTINGVEICDHHKIVLLVDNQDMTEKFRI